MKYTLTFATDSAEELAIAVKALPRASSEKLIGAVRDLPWVANVGNAPTPPAPLETKAVAAPVVAKAKKVKAEVVAPQPEPETLEEPDAFSADEVKKALTRADVSKAYINLSAAKGKDFALKVLAKLDVTGIKELDESQFEEAIAQAQEALKEGA